MAQPPRPVALAVVIACLLAAGAAVGLARQPALPRTVVSVPAGAPAPGGSTAGPAAAPPSAAPAPAPASLAAATPPPPAAVLQVPYRVVLDSPDPALADAPATIAAILEDPRGWQQAGVDFVADPAAPFTVVLAEGDRAQQLCLPYDVGGRFSCQNGPTVVLNAIRWREGVPHWPGDVASYRTMLVNHEVGHLIGMHHLRCTGPGAVAPVMEQQSGSLRGCTANPWPTAIELRLAATHQFVVAPDPPPGR